MIILSLGFLSVLFGHYFYVVNVFVVVEGFHIEVNMRLLLRISLLRLFLIGAEVVVVSPALNLLDCHVLIFAYTSG